MAPDIRRSADNKMLWINRDQNENAKRKYALIKACYKLLLKNKYPCSMKGTTITYNKQQYTYEMLNLLPESCTPQATKSRGTEDGMGLFFFSKHVYCSNFALAKIRYKGRVFTSVEHAYQYKKVKAAGYTELAAEMTGMTVPYKIKSIGDGTEPAKGCHLTSEKVMKELIKEKFLQNARLRDKLVYDGYSDYYEMTTDKKWATGVRLPNDGKPVNKALLTGGNKTGLLVGETKLELRRELGLVERTPRKATPPMNTDQTELNTT